MKSVLFETYSLLGCPCGAEVIICVDESLTASGAPYITGTIVSIDSVLDSNGRTVYQYVFAFNEGQLADPEHVLLTCEIEGAFCKNCLVDYIDFRTALVTNPCLELPVSEGMPLVCNSGNLRPIECGNLGDVLTITDTNPCAASWQPLPEPPPPESNDWHILGNSGTVDGTNFCGTIDNVAFDVRVNNRRARRTETAMYGIYEDYWAFPPGQMVQFEGAPNILDGYSGNSISLRKTGSAILSGGCSSGANFIRGFTGLPTYNMNDNNVICGGKGNQMWSYDEDLSLNYNAICGGVDILISIESSPGVYFPHDPNYDGQIYENFVGSGAGNGMLGAGGEAGIVGGSGNWIQSLVDWGPEIPVWIQDYFGSFIGAGSGNFIEGGNSCGVTVGEGNEIMRSYSCNIDSGEANAIGQETLFYVPGEGLFPDSFDSDCWDCAIVTGNLNAITGCDSSVIITGYGNIITTSSTTDSVLALDDSVIVGGYFNKIDCNPTDSDSLFALTTILGGAALFLGARSIGFQLGFEVPRNNPYVPDPTYTDLTAFYDIFYCGDADLWIGNVNNAARKIKWFEPNTSKTYTGTNFSSMEAQAQNADIEYKLPAAAGVQGQVLKIQSVAGTVVTLEWANDLT